VGRRRKGEEGVVVRSFVAILTVLSLGEKPNINPLLLVMFYGLKRLFGWALVE
jgi:hypothetical protein